MRYAVTVVAILALGACENAEPDATPTDEPQAEVLALEGTTYGEPLTLTEVTPVSAILEDPAAYIGERVLIDGMIVAVCEARGCWMEIASDREFEKIQVKVEDGVIVFPLSARGHHAQVEGVVEEIQMTYEQALEAAQHQAEEHGEEFDPSTVPEGPQTTYRIWVSGAVITD